MATSKQLNKQFTLTLNTLNKAIKRLVRVADNAQWAKTEAAFDKATLSVQDQLNLLYEPEQAAKALCDTFVELLAQVGTDLHANLAAKAEKKAAKVQKPKLHPKIEKAMTAVEKAQANLEKTKATVAAKVAKMVVKAKAVSAPGIQPLTEADYTGLPSTVKRRVQKHNAKVKKANAELKVGTTKSKTFSGAVAEGIVGTAIKRPGPKKAVKKSHGSKASKPKSAFPFPAAPNAGTTAAAHLIGD